MFISECILPGEKLIARRQTTNQSNALAIETSNIICLSIMGATAAEIDAIAAAINAPIERMKREQAQAAEAK